MKYILFIVLLVAIIITAGCVGGNQNPAVAPTPQIVYVTVLVTPIPTPTPTPQIVYKTVLVTPTSTPITQISTNSQSSVPADVELSIGQIVSEHGKQITVYSAQKVLSYTWTSSSINYQFNKKAKSGKTFVIVDAEVKNIGSDSIYVTYGDFSMGDSNGNRYDPEMYSGDDGLGLFKELYKNQKNRGKVIFEVPQNTNGLKLYYDFGYVFWGTKIASWNIN